MSICICNAIRCRRPGKVPETGEVYCGRARAVESAILAAVHVAAEDAGAMVGIVDADVPTMVRELAASGLEIRTIRKSRVAS